MKSKESKNANYWFFKSELPFVNFACKPLSKGPHDSGWGIAWNDNKKWNVYKEGKDDIKPYHFEKIGEVYSTSILVHLRAASVGKESSINAHPFIYKNFAFEHNGTVNRELLMKYLSPKMASKLTSESDSEVFFLLIMQLYEDSQDIIGSIKKSVNIAKKYTHTSLNFILSDFENVYAYRDISKDKKDLLSYYSLYYLSKENDVLVCSEKLSKDKWIEIKIGSLLIINSDLEIEKIAIQ